MAERFEIVEKALLTMLEEKKYSTLRDILITMNPSDVAGLFDGLRENQIPVLFRLLPKELATDTFVEMEPDTQAILIRGFSDNELREVLDDLFVDDAADIVEEMPADVVGRILQTANSELRSTINQILCYPENSAGSIMTTEYVSLSPNMTVGEALYHIRRQGVDKETIYTCYILDPHRNISGIVTVKDLLLAGNDDTQISEIMLPNPIFVSTLTDKEDVAKMLSKYNFLALPVVDGQSRMVGIVTFDDAMDVLEEAATEDIEIMAGITPSEKVYLKSTPIDLFLHRIPWLMLLMVSATFTGLIITSFEDSLSILPVLTAFIPMLMDTGGNSGSQSSVTIIRALSLDEIKFADLAKVVWKEFRTAILCGLTLAVVCFIKVLLIDRLLLGNTDVSMLVSAVVCLTLCVTVIIAKFVGCSLPLLAKRLGFDPAVMASPFITTIVDALSLLVYFLFAQSLLLK